MQEAQNFDLYLLASVLLLQKTYFVQICYLLCNLPNLHIRALYYHLIFIICKKRKISIYIYWLRYCCYRRLTSFKSAICYVIFPIFIFAHYTIISFLLYARSAKFPSIVKTVGSPLVIGVSC